MPNVETARRTPAEMAELKRKAQMVLDRYRGAQSRTAKPAQATRPPPAVVATGPVAYWAAQRAATQTADAAAPSNRPPPAVEGLDKARKKLDDMRPGVATGPVAYWAAQRAAASNRGQQ